MLDSSGTFQKFSLRRIHKELNYEMRILFLTLNIDGRIVIPQSYFFEFPTIRNILNRHSCLLELGYFQFISDYADPWDFIEYKKYTYEKAIWVPKYNDAYFKNNLYGFDKLPTQIACQAGNIGGKMITPWTKIIENEAKEIGYPTDRIKELSKRVNETESKAFLYDNLLEHIIAANITKSEAKILKIRSHYNGEYLRTYREKGMEIPTNSSLVSNALLPNSNNNKYNINLWKRIFTLTKFNNYVNNASCKQILELKLNASFSIIIEKIKNKSFLSVNPSFSPEIKELETLKLNSYE